MTIPDGLRRALENAADAAILAPSVHNTQPWEIVLHADRMELRADRTRQLAALDPTGRELVQSVGAALFNARVSLAGQGWAARVDRVPRSEDPDLLAVVRPVPGPRDEALAALAPAIASRHTNRRRFGVDRLPDAVLATLAADVEREDALLVPVLTDDHRRLVARLTQQADRLQNADPAYRAEIRRWTTRAPEDGDGVPPEAVAHVDGLQADALPLRDFDTLGTGGLPAETGSGPDQTLVLLATRSDTPEAWLHAGEALQHVLLELTRDGWVAGPLTQPVEVPVTRTQLRAALSWDAHPQMLLRIGRAQPTPATPRRPRADAVAGSSRPDRPVTAPERVAPATATGPPPAEPVEPVDEPAGGRRPVSDGRGGTVWIG